MEKIFHITTEDDENEPQDWEDLGQEDPWGRSQFDEDAADNDVLEAHTDEPVNEGTAREMDEDESYSDSDCESVAESENEYVLDYGEFLRTMTIDETRDAGGKRGYVPTLDPVQSYASRSLKRPRHTNQEKRCLVVFLEVNGHKAFTLCDSGCTTELMSHDFAHIVQPELFELNEPVTIQLGTKGSRSQIIYGAFAPFSYDSDRMAVSGREYFDIANISLDFEYDVVRVKGQPMPTLLEKEELHEIARRYSANVQPKKKLEGLVVPTKLRPSRSIPREDVKSDIKGKARASAEGERREVRTTPLWMHVEESEKAKSNESASAGLSRHLPVLLGPEDGITIEDVEDIANRAMAMDIADPQMKIYLNEIDELLRELELPRYSHVQTHVEDEMVAQTQAEVIDDIPCLSLEESLQATAGLFQMRTRKDSDQELTEEDVPRLHQQWMECCADILAGPPEKLPPLREVNHTIPLIDDAKKYQYYTPKE
ncbi:hypothetical protein BDZ89DRAFT_1133630 [Hymenopellis radicata]|nr:hypothetical protein BDZ89DRAFT_1133630 [Hymenopellis radicata]